MAETRKVTFTLPIELTERLNRQIRSLDRSAFVAEAIADLMEARRQRLVVSCIAANADDDLELQRDMDVLVGDGVDAHVPWNATPVVRA